MKTQQSCAQTRTQRSMLVVDGDAIFRKRLVQAMFERGFDASGARSVDQAVGLARRNPPSHALVDSRMPDGSCLDVLEALRALNGDTRIVILTGYGSIASAVTALRAGATNYLTKPADADEIIAAFELYRAAGRRPTADFAVPSLERVEWEHIQRVLHGCSGNISQAARLLGVHRRSLQRKLAKRPDAPLDSMIASSCDNRSHNVRSRSC